MKTTHFLFTTGLSSTDRKPAGREDFLQTDGKYYVLSGKRIPYQRDKTQDERFSILTRFAIAKELERTGQVSEEDVVQVSLPIGVPPKHYAELAERYREYFLGDGKVQELVYNVRGKVILQPHGKEFFTWYSKHLFTLHGKHFFT